MFQTHSWLRRYSATFVTSYFAGSIPVECSKFMLVKYLGRYADLVCRRQGVGISSLAPV